MKNLFLCEWKRLWCRKTIWICFFSIPIILYASAKYYLRVNQKVIFDSPQFTSFGNFPTAAIQEQLVLAFNLIVILIAVMSITEEYRSGQLRMIMIRPIKFSEIFIAKFLVLIVTIALYSLIYFLFSLILGYFLFPKINDISIFYHVKVFGISASLMYSVKYYLLALLTLIAISSVVFFISIISKSVIIALGVNVGFILISMTYPIILQAFFRGGGLLINKIMLLSLTHIQHMGIAFMLGQKHTLFLYISFVLLAYTLIFSTLSYFVFSKQDQLI
ncbi:ABC-2 family transporter protein [Clostridium cavendishii DSM 21758]|uniref:ABC-2 family transporter protein n=1 Tax=Clostridium cavendishii DSM 21758 TaxID=1121302 RepID=A0A1M6J1R7_9CLOT|nr:ABC transporter permease [Clostridium cavendishii]SHJ40587.1 ABC-2 family transporter protein [Clostridium cavendishii DSM 21758]